MVTMQDIATRAGVNKGTVSYILNGKHKQARIGDKICLQVKDIAKELGYQRNELARSVATGKSNVLAFVSCVNSSDEYTSRIMAGIVEELTEQKFALKVYHLSSDNSLDIAKQIISQRVVGVIFHAPLNSDFKIVQQAMKKNHIPCATTNLTSKHVDLGVTTDDTQGVEDSVKHLAELGHQRILYFSYQDDEHSEYIQHREAGYIAGMKRYVGQSAVPRVESSPIGFFNNKKIIERVLSEPSDQRPTAVICINDAVALRVMQVAYQMGIKLPEELSVIGFADLEMAKYAIVPLTTIAQPFEEMGRKTAKSLLGIIKKHKTQSPGVKNKILPTKLIIRESTRAVVN